jgi:hypothetical protein
MANTEMWKSILCELLNCGYLDLDILDDADEDYVLEAIDDCKANGIPVSLNAITDAMFLEAQTRINGEWDARLDELGSDEANGYADEDELKELEAIKELNPEEDITWYCNCLDTGIYIINNKYDVYKEYFGDLLDELENKMGFEFGY